jgi:hypothetical protein
MFAPSANPTITSSFNNLASLQTVSLLGSQISLPDQIFANCPALTSVLASNLASSVAANSFTGCNALTKLELFYTTSNASYSAILGQRAAQTAYTIADASFNAVYNPLAAAGEQMRLNISRITAARQSLQDVSWNSLNVSQQWASSGPAIVAAAAALDVSGAVPRWNDSNVLQTIYTSISGLAVALTGPNIYEPAAATVEAASTFVSDLSGAAQLWVASGDAPSASLISDGVSVMNSIAQIISVVTTTAAQNTYRTLQIGRAHV